MKAAKARSIVHQHAVAEKAHAAALVEAEAARTALIKADAARTALEREVETLREERVELLRRANTLHATAQLKAAQLAALPLAPPALIAHAEETAREVSRCHARLVAWSVGLTEAQAIVADLDAKDSARKVVEAQVRAGVEAQLTAGLTLAEVCGGQSVDAYVKACAAGRPAKAASAKLVDPMGNKGLGED